MPKINQTELKKDISKHLSSAENLTSIAVFKKVPSTGSLMLTRGMTWFFAQRFYVGVTDRRLIILPDKVNRMHARMDEEVVFAGFDEVKFYTDAFNTSILSIQINHQEKPFKLRLIPGYHIDGMDQFDFITAVKQHQNS